MMTTEQGATPRIYVASLSDYNAGRLVGRWIDADQDAEDIAAEVDEMLEQDGCAGAEEWAIHDYEGFGSLKLGEWESFETVATIAQALAEHGPAWAAYVDYVGGVEYADAFEEAYAGEWDSEEDFARDLADDIRPFGPNDPEARIVEQWPYSYIDWKSAARDLFMGDYFSVDTDSFTVYVFRSL